MFRTIVKSRNGHQPLTSGKRQISTSSNTPLAQMNDALRQLPKKPDMVQELRKLRTSSIYGELMNWTKKQYEIMPKSGNVDADPQVRHVANGHALYYAVDSVVHLSNNFDLTTSVQASAADKDPAALERDFLRQIRAHHADRLRTEFRNSWRANSVLRQAALLSALEPGLAHKLGLTPGEHHAVLAKQWGIIPPALRLTEGELLALVDYVNSSTGTFNAVNGAALTAAYYGEPVLQHMTATFTASLDSAIHKLCRHPYFGRQQVVTYKGICLSNESGIFRRAMLEAAVGTGRRIPFPNVISATANPAKSYAATKPELGYSAELQITMPTAFDADAFHDTNTMGEEEVIGPRGQTFVITKKIGADVYTHRAGRFEQIDRYELEHKR